MSTVCRKNALGPAESWFRSHRCANDGMAIIIVNSTLLSVGRLFCNTGVFFLTVGRNALSSLTILTVGRISARNGLLRGGGRASL